MGNCEKKYLVRKNVEVLFSCVAILCFCDENEYSKENKFNLTNNNFILQTNSRNAIFVFASLSIVISLVFALIFYETNKNSEFFEVFLWKNEGNNLNDDNGKGEKSGSRKEKVYDYMLLNDQQNITEI